MLQGNIALRLREIIMEICAQNKMDIISGNISLIKYISWYWRRLISLRQESNDPDIIKEILSGSLRRKKKRKEVYYCTTNEVTAR
ncbi:MAG: hypothetical protein D3913_07345 [Candidatus Electrothrix sp. LOE1_4_5]|nr:hypothetical protein [Candidatus Electrothrix gigas]